MPKSFASEALDVFFVDHCTVNFVFSTTAARVLLSRMRLFQVAAKRSIVCSTSDLDESLIAHSDMMLIILSKVIELSMF